MQVLFHDLYKLLTDQLGVVNKLRNGVERQISAMRTNNLEDLRMAVNEIGLQSSELDRLEAQRRDVQEQLEKALGLSSGATLRVLIGLAPIELKEPLDRLRAELRDTLLNMNEANGVAQAMSLRGLQISTALVRLLGGGEGGTYSSGGGLQGPVPGSSLDQSV